VFVVFGVVAVCAMALDAVMTDATAIAPKITASVFQFLSLFRFWFISDVMTVVN
jgi:hypothetical protein